MAITTPTSESLAKAKQQYLIAGLDTSKTGKEFTGSAEQMQAISNVYGFQKPAGNTQIVSTADQAKSFLGDAKNYADQKTAEAVNKQGQTMAQANDPASWKDGKYVGAQAPATPPVEPKGTETPNPTDDIQAQIDKNYADFKTQVQTLYSGTFTLTPGEQAQISALQASYDKIKQQQEEYNKNYTGGVTQLAGRTGLTRYGGDLAMQNINKAVSDGISKVQDIETKAAGAISSLKAEFENKWETDLDKKYARISDLYKTSQDYLKQKEQAIKDINDAARVALKAAQDKNTYTFGTLDKYAAGGIVPSSADMKKFDEALGGPGLAQQYFDAAQTKATTEKQLKTYDDVYKVLETIPEGTKVKIGDNTYEGTKDAGNSVMKEYNAKTGIVTTIVVDKKGNIISTNQASTTKTAPGSTPVAPGTTTTFNEKTELANTIAAAQKYVGQDGKIAPWDYAKLRTTWVNRGGNPTTFDTKMKGFRDPANPNYNIGK